MLALDEVNLIVFILVIVIQDDGVLTLATRCSRLLRLRLRLRFWFGSRCARRRPRRGGGRRRWRRWLSSRLRFGFRLGFRLWLTRNRLGNADRRVFPFRLFLVINRRWSRGQARDSKSTRRARTRRNRG
jgi:hypothetical protein